MNYLGILFKNSNCFRRSIVGPVVFETLYFQYGRKYEENTGGLKLRE